MYYESIASCEGTQPVIYTDVKDQSLKEWSQWPRTSHDHQVQESSGPTQWVIRDSFLCAKVAWIWSWSSFMCHYC